MNNALLEYSAAELRDKLTSFTIGSGREINFDKAGEIFSEYILRALPGTQVLGVQPFRTTAALNSIAALVRIRRQNDEQEVFAKIHIESGTKSVSAVGVEGEYRNAQLLASAGWPVLAPLEAGVNKDYPILLYPKTDAATLFQLLEQSYAASRALLTQEDMHMVEKLNQQVGGATRQTLGQIDRLRAVEAPVQNLFLNRFVAGGRIDQWYAPETEFRLPGIDKPVPWEKISDARWIINGEKFGTTLYEVIAKARKSLSFQGEETIAAAVSHGDDHAGNVFIDRKLDKAVVFDPAFAGLNPISLCDLKAFAHTGFLPMAGLYYDPKLEKCRYGWDQEKNIISVEINFQKTPVYEVHEALARQIMNERIIPLYKKASADFSINMARERERITCGLVGCALLTINVPMLLEKSDGRGRGLLPMAIMFAELRGFSVLEELDRELMNI